MKVQMKLCSDTIFGNGISIPGGEDIAVLCDDQGFPYYKGSTFKGIFREEMLRLLQWKGMSENESKNKVNQWLGESGNDLENPEKIVFTDFTISDRVKKVVMDEIGNKPHMIMDLFTNLRIFTRIDENGTAAEKSMRMARCVNEGIVLYSEILCSEKQEETVKEVLGLIKWIGAMRNRGFGKIQIKAEGEAIWQSI